MGEPQPDLGTQQISNRRVMKRCFMNGQRCKYQILDENPSKDPKIFVIMPFTPNLKTYYDWRLKQFLMEKYGLKDDNLQYADDVGNTGYIICGKICNKIQESDLILADVSLANPNVFYELGLACGLQRPIVLMRHKTDRDIFKNKCIMKTLNFLKEPEIIEYSEDEYSKDKGVYRPITRDFFNHANFPPKYERVKKVLKFSVLGFNRETESAENEKKDIAIPFRTLIKAAAEVVIKEILDGIQIEVNLKPWQKVIKDFDSETLKKFSIVNRICIDCTGKSEAGVFGNVVKGIEESFCIIIDVSNNDPVAYFWLGYCHARGFNAIPVNRIKSGASQTQEKSKLAFDIGALWYAEFDDDEPYRFKDRLLETITNLLERDLPDWQRQAFWDRFPPESRLKVFMGAIHDNDHLREVVGDWDVRTVSELFSYLPSVREATNIELVTPLYSPEEAIKRVKGENAKIDIDFINEFCVDIRKLLRGSNAIVIASPDVNPVTEYLLHEIYHIKDNCKPFRNCNSSSFKGVVAVKKRKETSQKIERLFYYERGLDNNEEETRGFINNYIDQHGKPHHTDFFETYKSQIEQTAGEFELLGHLVVAHYPEKSDNLVVLLNGLSGPATFALSQILTGSGKKGELNKVSQSENMLKKINEILDRPDCVGVQAIVRVKMRREKSMNLTYVDSRIVDSWEFHPEYEANPIV